MTQLAALFSLVVSGIAVFAVMAHVTGALRLSELRRVMKRG
jgi:hypothetical protein